MPHVWLPLNVNPDWPAKKRDVTTKLGRHRGRLDRIFSVADDESRGFVLAEVPDGFDGDALARDLEVSRADVVELRSR